ncbi:MAG TPA: PLP-dependent aminotransferase family protein [Anaeromyxobacteraceae bacterium]|nr:PLP-dependent aminotransferase family protein [Anaeromyxobacteraceae bacterium]
MSPPRAQGVAAVDGAGAAPRQVPEPPRTPEPSAPQARRRDPGVPLYEDLARRFARAIETGALRTGDRLPSVRELRAQERVSTATVMQALARLEFLGLVESRPRSGYFVRPRRLLPVPAPTRPPAAPRPVSVAALVARIIAANRDERLVPLGVAAPTPALVPTAALVRALNAVVRPSVGGALGYELPPGHEPLRRDVARRALSWGFAAGPDDVVVTSGASEAIYLALRAVTKPGDIVAIESPAYYGTLQALEALSLRAVEVPCHPDTGLDLDALESILARQKVAAVLAVPNFSNPSGSLMPEEAKRRLARLLAERGTPLVEDDIYGDLGFGEGRPPSVKAFDREGLVLTCGSFSKTLAPGWRVGFVLPGRYREQVTLLKFAINVASSAGPQRAIARFLETGAYDRHLRRLRSALHGSMERMSAAVHAAFPPGTRVSHPAGGYVLWVELPESVDALELHGRALDAGVSVVPGQLFGARGGFDHFIRLSYGHPWDERLRHGVETIGRIATRLAERGPAPA